MKNILVLGGTKYVGKKLVSKLIQRGFHVTIASRKKYPQDSSNKIEQFFIERENIGSLKKALGSRHWDVVFDQICFNENDATVSCEYFNGKVSRYIIISSQAVYPAGQQHLEQAFNPLCCSISESIDENLSYSIGKRQAEKYFYHYALFPVVAVRFPIILGNDDPLKRFQNAVQKIYQDKYVWLENITADISLINSDDASNFLFWLLSQNFSCPINACSTDTITVGRIIQLIQIALGISIDIKQHQHLIVRDPYQVHTAWEENSNLFPLSIQDHWSMNSAFANQSGFSCQPINSWLPQFINEIAADILSN